MKMDCEYLIVGGGSAGCVLANRLSADPRNRVVLLEAGRDMSPGQEEPAILDSYPRIAYFNQKNVWPELRVHLTESASRSNSASRYEQARLIGGGSSLNDMQAPRGLPGDYDEWAQLGAEGWNWAGVLPYFRRLERDLDFGGDLHGADGPLPVRRIAQERWPLFSKAAAAAFRAAGYKEHQDQNGCFDDGFFPIAITNVDDRRVSTAIAYLNVETRARPNLRIIDRAMVQRLCLDGRRVIGADASTPSGPIRVCARETILSAGAIHSPALLLRAGIGPAATLRPLGIEVVASRPGVGRNLMEHPALSVSSWIAPHARLRPELRRHIHVALRYTSSLDGTVPSDMFMVAVSRTGWHPVGERIGSLLTYVNKSYSTGRVELTSPDSMAEPAVHFDMLSDPRDLARLKEGLIFAARLFADSALSQITDVPFPTSYSERIRDLGVPSARTWLLTWLLAQALDSGHTMRRLLIERLITDGAPLHSLLARDDLLEEFVLAGVHGLWHPSCTCRMGRPDDPQAVTDPRGRVIGIEGIRVADASVMPVIPRANTNITTIMIAEKISAAILADHDETLPSVSTHLSPTVSSEV